MIIEKVEILKTLKTTKKVWTTGIHEYDGDPDLLSEIFLGTGTACIHSTSFADEQQEPADMSTGVGHGFHTLQVI